MSIVSEQVKRTRYRSGFTLLEIILAVAILGMMALAIYRFVQSNLIAISVSSKASAADARYDGLRDLLTAQWQSLVPGTGALLGEALKVEDRPRDEIRWICGAGPGLLTRYAPGDFVVALRLQRESEKSDRLNLGFLRKPKNDQAITAENETWVSLIANVNSLQIRYFDPRLNSWLDRWSDNLTLPRLVKVTIGPADGLPPWEVIIPLGRTPL
jgi:prepilin-type N-terminal cleavage/methylation domain-containing protein